MQPDDMILVSVDDHLVEPPNLFEQRTVGALRAEAGDHDAATRSFDHGRSERTVGVSLGSMSAKLNV